MNINEDRFINKSAEEIALDILNKHKDNPIEALSYIQSIQSDEGLVLTQEIKDNLKKAEDILLKHTNLKEADIFKHMLSKFKNKFNKPHIPTADVEIKMFMSFDSKPLTYIVKNVTSLNDPRIKQICKELRNLHSHAPIQIRSDIWNKTIYENTEESYTIDCVGIDVFDDKYEDEYQAGTLQIAFEIAEKLYQTHKYYLIEVKKDDKVIAKYSNNKWEVQEDLAEGTFSSELKKVATSDFGRNLISTGLGAVLGISPAVINTLATPTINNLEFDNTQNAYDKYVKKAKEKDKSIDTYADWLKKKHKRRQKKEEVLVEDDTRIDKAYFNKENDIASIDERLAYERHGIHPNLDDKRKPKWNDFSSEDEYPAILDQDEKQNPIAMGLDTNKTAKYNFRTTLHIDMNKYRNYPSKLVLVGIDADTTTDDNDPVYVQAKIPNTITEKGTITYKDGKIYKIPVRVFKALIHIPSNQSTLEKFEKLHSEDMDTLIALDTAAKSIIDNRFNDWYNTYKDVYNLDLYEIPTQAEIYKAWKVAKDIHNTELTKEDIEKQFGIKFYKATIKPYIKDIEAIISKIDNKNTAAELQEQFNDKLIELFNNSDYTDEQIQDIITKWTKDVAAFYGWENLVNQKYNDILNKLTNRIKAEIPDKLDDLLTDLQQLRDNSIKKMNVSNKVINIDDVESPAFMQALTNIVTKWKDILQNSMKKDTDIKSDVSKISKKEFDEWKDTIYKSKNITTKAIRNDKKVEISLLDIIENKLRRLPNSKDWFEELNKLLNKLYVEKATEDEIKAALLQFKEDLPGVQSDNTTEFYNVVFPDFKA